MAMEVRTLYSIFHDRCLVRRALIYHGLHLFSSWNTELRYFPLDSCLQACNGHSVVCVPLYDTLGLDAVEFIANHAEIAIAFVQESKLPLMIQTLPKCTTYLKTLVSFGTFTSEQKAAAEESGVALYSWQDFMVLGANNPVDLAPPAGDDLSTIMYTSGTTGEPKGVLLTHKSILTTIAGLDHYLKSLNEVVDENDVYFSFLPLAHIFDRVAEEMFVFAGSSIGFWQGVWLEPVINCTSSFISKV
jgi:long-chain acyl-CoA synthetase